MRKLWSKNVVFIMLSFVLMLSPMLPSSQLVLAKQGKANVEDMLQGLTEAERAALQQLEASPGFTIHPEINVTDSNPVQVIVEFKQDPAKVTVLKAKAEKQRSAVSMSKAAKQVDASHQEFKQAIGKWKRVQSSASTDVEITQEYRDAFNGVAMTLPGNQVEDLLDTGVVKRIWKNEEVQLTFPETNGGKMKPKMIDSIPQIGVDKLHKEGITGAGIKVGVIDTGIDYHHPDLVNAYAGYQQKEGEDPSEVNPDSVKGWDFVDDDADPMEMTYEEWLESGQPEFAPNGSSYYTSHGTHVSGTIAGQKENDMDGAVKGVAPDVDLYSYRVLGAYGSGETAWVLAGIDKAVKDEMDVINLSLGINTNDPLSPTSVAVNNAMLAGVVTTVAAGNTGPGEKTVGSPGAAALPITVGASDVSQNIPTFTATAGELVLDDVELLAKHFTDNLADYQDQSLAVVDAGLGSEADFANVNVEGKIALIERGELTFDEKISNAKAAGAAATIVYNNEEGQIPHYVGENVAYIPSFRLSQADGEALQEAVAAGAEFTFGELGNIQTQGDHLADFSSRGPVEGTYDIKPDVVAPGVAIYSTVPAFINDPENESYDVAYARMQGTSMATPHVAGAIALILQENPDFTPFDVKAALMNTSVALQEDYSVYEVGAGRINAYRAVHADTALIVQDETATIDGEMDNPTGSLSYGSNYQEGDQPVEVSKDVELKNTDPDTDKSYDINAEFLPESGKILDAETNGVHFKLPDTIDVAAGKSEILDAKIHVPTDAAYGQYEGYLYIVNQQNEQDSYRIPFAIRVTDKGIDYMEVSPPAISTEATPVMFTMVRFKLKSEPDTIDVLVHDQETGEPVGFVGTMDVSMMAPDRDLGMRFNGRVYLFTDDPSNPISTESTALPEGVYQLEMIGYDADGKTYQVEDVFVTDNTPPEMTFLDYEPGIYEVDESMYTVEDGESAVWVHTNIYDSTIDVLKELGKDVDQSSNILFYMQDNMIFPGQIPVQPNGDAKFGIPAEEIADGPTSLHITAVDMASGSIARIRHDAKYTFIKKGSDYAIPSYNQEKVFLGDTFKMTLSLNNVKQLMNSSFQVNYDMAYYEFVDFSANEALENYAEENGLDIHLDEPEITEGNFNTELVKVGASLDKEGFAGLDGDMPFLDVTFKVIGDEYYVEPRHLDVLNFTYERYGEADRVTIPVLSRSSDRLQLIAKHSVLKGYIKPEAFLDEGSLSLNVDFSTIGASVYVEDGNGDQYEGTLDKNGQYEVRGIPVERGDYTLVVEVPGHLPSVNPVEISREADGEVIGRNISFNAGLNPAGDINQDGVIDIHDVMRIVAKYGKADEKLDINQDGIVDETDIRFIEKNFLEVGPDAKKQPMEKLGKKGLADLLKALGLEPLE